MSTEKIIERIRKLLALSAKGSGATEAEASTAAAKAAEIMEEYGLTTMSVEMAGGSGENRATEKLTTTHEPWQKPLMEAIAESCFCYLDFQRVGAHRKFEFRLIGRQSAVVTAGLMFDYLRKTISQLSRKAGVDSAFRFRCGCAERLGERLRERHAEKLRQQKAEAEARQRAAAAASGGSTSTALVVTLEDYDQREKDLNNDYRMGLQPGTTAARRAAKSAKEREQEAQLAALEAQGIEHGVAWNMVYLGHTRERAEEYEQQWKKKNERRESRYRSSWTQADERRHQAYQREAERRSSPSWTAGRSAGDHVGLDPQIDKKSPKTLG